jgi:tRNA (guanine37-N1)-methyltransferase
MESLCLVVPKKKAEPVRRRLLEKGILRKGLKVKADSKSVYLPVTQRIDLGYPVEKSEFEELEEQVRDYRTLTDVPDELRPLLPSSYDTVGSVAIVKMSEEVMEYAQHIGKAIMAVQKSIRTVCVDFGIEDRIRRRNIRVVAGDKNTETVHKEYGLTFKLDVSKVFFSPRLASEREIVAKAVKPGEVVVDMFAGIGPFSIMIAKMSSPKAVYAIDVNPDAIRYMNENIALNKTDVVRPVLGDSREVMASIEPADRVVMNLPHEAHKYVDVAIDHLRPGGVIHFYDVLEEPGIDARLEEISALARSRGRTMKELARRKVKSYSPTLNVYGFDLAFF